ALLEPVEAHRTEDRGRLGELDVAVVDDLDVVAPRIVEVERAARADAHAGFGERLARSFLVVDYQAEVPGLIRRLGAPGGQRDELVAHVDERHTAAVAAPQLELEEAPVPGQGVVDVPDLQGDVVDADQA